ncbi:MAG TPA: alcohol dehydrogenase catalytic domain-containing protein [Candidatus Binatia bacterium]|jgi:threonine dehydrogenase-like Zn-dependent dehydrogenase
MTGIEARYEAAGRIGVREVELGAPGAGEVRVRVLRCGICGSDLHAFRGRAELPLDCPGHEMSGIVDAVGPGARGVREGDRVAVEPLRRCGDCRHCLAGNYHLCGRLALSGVTAPGGMASAIVVPDYALFALPSSLDFALGALAEPMAVSVHAARLGGAGPGSRVLVLGAGTIGLVAVAAARHLGAEYVAISARHPQQKKLAAALGADEILDPEQLRPSGEKPDVVIETVGGTASTVGDAMLAVARGGTVVVVGLFEKTPVFDPGVMILKEVRMVGSMVYNHPPGGAADFAIALDVIADRAQALRALVTHTFALEDVQRAFETASDKASGAVKVMLAPAEG